MSAIRRIAYACACVAAFVLLAATVSGYAQASQKWYASGHYSSWSNGVKGTLRTYNNYVSSNDVFTAIYVAIVFPNNDWLAVGFYAGHPLTCGLTTQPIWYWDQGVNGVYSCGRIDGRYPSMGTDYIYKVYLVPGTTQWNGNIDSSLVKTTTFSYNYGYGYGYGEANSDGNQMNGWFRSMQYGLVRGGTTIYWYDWSSLATYSDPPYKVTVVSAKEFKTSSTTNP